MYMQKLIYVCVCVNVCMYGGMHACKFVCMYVCMYYIFNQPRIPLEQYEEFVEDFGSLIEGTTLKMQNAWDEFRESVGLPKAARMEAVESAFISALVDWQELVSRAQEEIGNGNRMVYMDVYAQFGLVNDADVSIEQLKDIEREMFELIDLMREILIHAASRIEEDPENGNAV